MLNDTNHLTSPGYVLDGWGGLHAVNGAGAPTPVTPAGSYTPGNDIFNAVR